MNQNLFKRVLLTASIILVKRHKILMKQECFNEVLKP